jgi:meiotic recombination protein REC8
MASQPSGEQDMHAVAPASSDKTTRLVATLGAKSSLKRINRKQILDVDVAKACQTIVDPVAPMALRLQSNLL